MATEIKLVFVFLDKEWGTATLPKAVLDIFSLASISPERESDAYPKWMTSSAIFRMASSFVEKWGFL